MSSSRMVFDGRRQPGRSNFVQTCNLLSRYIKEKGSLRDLNIEIGGKAESLEHIVKPVLTQSSIKQQPFVAPKSSVDAPTSCKEDPAKPSQLTIFYSGRVLVFDDYPSNKVEELVAFAKKESSCSILSSNMDAAGGPISSSRDGLPPRPHQAGTGSHKAAAISSNASKEKKSSTTTTTTTDANGSGKLNLLEFFFFFFYEIVDGCFWCVVDLPIARRSSLHRFLEKRKDRYVCILSFFYYY
ncbi:protein TIFY 10a-like isoform X1 [Salvia miltiorrhiza]|uniref:protein TIFY 10a-like isoform X1 n=1 Tax=Salvia miltiorrhiza TaxID=226208 RepID=UPI0025ACEE85|nr:protein TIFY 10a-like isoform X1 [Salvia miltiorrhiza]